MDGGGINMKLLVCIIDNFYADEVERRLKEKGYRMTELSSTGGFFQKGNTTFLFGIEEKDVDQLSQELQSACLEVEKKKQQSSKQKYRYTSFLLPVNGALPFVNLP